jgi:biopolymer transport protein ExbD
MAMQTLSTDDGQGDDRLSADINTTPLVDVMLVLLIIFLITVPAVTQSVPVTLPRERIEPLAADVQAVTLAVDRDGSVFWGAEPLANLEALRQRLAQRMASAGPESPAAGARPDTSDAGSATRALPEVHIRADEAARWDTVAAVHRACVEAGVSKVGFITDPTSPRGTATR